MTSSQRRYLIATAPVTGAAIMIIEILGAKMLAPYIGTSLFVWTAQISVTMIALAAGYALGGFIADRTASRVADVAVTAAATPRATRRAERRANANAATNANAPSATNANSPSAIITAPPRATTTTTIPPRGASAPLYFCILGAALALVIGTLIRESVALTCLQLGLRAGSFLASCALFFVPLCLLATVPPMLVRNLASGLDSIGRVVGRLSAISTIGSVLGTLAIGYLLIPNFSNTTIMLATAAALALTALAYLLAWRVTKPGAPLFLAFAILAFSVPALLQRSLRLPSGNLVEIHRANSSYGLLQVLDDKDEGTRYYLNDLLFQNIYDPRARQSAAEFTYMLHGLARAYTPQIRDVLCIGMGVGIVPMQFATEGAQVDIVEINPAVVPIAEKYFDFNPARIRTLAINDGRPALAASKNLYDTIILDAFLGDAPPSHLMTREAFAEMKRHLRPDGTLVINSFGSLDAGSDFFTASLEKTLAAVFATVRLCTNNDGNNYYIATDRPDARPLRAPDLSDVPSTLRDAIAAIYKNERTTTAATTATVATATVATTTAAITATTVAAVATVPEAIVLTDNYNPIEYYDARNRESNRRSLLALLSPQPPQPE